MKSVLPSLKPLKPNLSFPIKRRQGKLPVFLLLPVLLLLVFSLGIGGAYLSTHLLSEDARFTRLTDAIFQEEVTSNTLNLHYTLAYPEEKNIHPGTPTLGVFDANPSEAINTCHTYESRLLSFLPEKLSYENQITRDALLLYFHTQKELLACPLLYEPLSPHLGIQAQLPILLAEYTFYEDSDVADYLQLLTTIKPYFASLLAYEQEKAAAGYFMSDETLDRVLEQCTTFLSDQENNYLQLLFEENLSKLQGLSKETQEKLSSTHLRLLKKEVFPAYQQLMDGLNQLRGSGKSSRGLSAFPNGKAYYLALLKSETGIYRPITEIEKELSEQLQKDCKQIQLMLKEQPSLISKLNNSSLFQNITPEESLTLLKDALPEAFPPLTDVSPEIRTVHPSMQEYASPAFYLTPPMDLLSPNVIYLNPKNQTGGLEQFTTLAHEGFPGHLYQTITFAQENTNPARYFFSVPGYTEGWATYVEEWAAEKAVPLLSDPAAKDIAHLYTLNRNVNLCIYTMIDIGIHYHSWSLSETRRFLAAFGIKDEKITGEIFQYIVENPANYPKYCLGFLELKRIKEQETEKKGKAFDLTEFHKKILSIGPVPFPVLEKYIR